MYFELTSIRLQRALDAAIEGAPIADIGTDHAHLPIASVLERHAPRAIGVDSAEKALAAGETHVTNHGVEDRVELRLGDGLLPLRPGDEIETVVMAGVGARTIREVMQPDVLEGLGIGRLVLQPNRTEIDTRRDILTTPGWQLIDETLVREDGYFYVVFSVELCTSAETRSLDQVPLEDQLLGPHLRTRGGELFRAYAAELADLLEPHLTEVDADRMPDDVRDRLERRLGVFRDAAEG